MVTARPLARTFSEDIGQVPPPPPFFFLRSSSFYFVEAVFFFFFFLFFFFFFFFFFCSHLNELSSSLIIIIEQFFGVHPRRTANRGAPRTRGRREARRRRRTRILVRCRRKACYLQRSSGRCRWKKWKAKSALLKRWSVKELAREVKANHASKCPHSKAKFKGPPPLEKEELVEVVLSLRGDPMCSVCFEQFVEDEYVRVLPCGHRYHIECVDRWLASKSIRCPMCQHPADER